jgi:hypothetical protein
MQARFAPVEMTKEGAVVARDRGCGKEKTADLSTALRSGRDDKGEGRLWPVIAAAGRRNRR